MLAVFSEAERAVTLAMLMKAGNSTNSDGTIVRAFDFAVGRPFPPAIETPVYFAAHELRRRWPELDGPDSLMAAVDAPAVRWGPGENTWVVLSYLNLKARGVNVKIVDRLMPDAVNVCYLDAVLGSRDSHRAFVVTAQADRCYLNWGEYTLAQSPELARRKDTCLIDMWPQPGLLARDPGRGDAIKRVGYTGNGQNLAAAFRSEGFRRRLAELGVELVIRDQLEKYHDFSDLDLHLAVRDTPWKWIRTKPSTKLVHSWITGVPALLGPEPSYRYWGQNGVDYFEVATPDDAVRVIRQLKEDPQLYRAVRERGSEKAKLHDEDAVCRQWAAMLAGPVQERFRAWSSAGGAGSLGRRARRQWQRVAVPLSRKWFFLRVRGSEAVREKVNKLFGRRQSDGNG